MEYGRALSLDCGHRCRSCLEFSLGTFKIYDGTATKTSPQNVTLPYRKFLAVRTSPSRRTM